MLANNHICNRPLSSLAPSLPSFRGKFDDVGGDVGGAWTKSEAGPPTRSRRLPDQGHGPILVQALLLNCICDRLLLYSCCCSSSCRSLHSGSVSLSRDLPPQAFHTDRQRMPYSAGKSSKPRSPNNIPDSQHRLGVPPLLHVPPYLSAAHAIGGTRVFARRSQAGARLESGKA